MLHLYPHTIRPDEHVGGRLERRQGGAAQSTDPMISVLNDGFLQAFKQPYYWFAYHLSLATRVQG